MKTILFFLALLPFTTMDDVPLVHEEKHHTPVYEFPTEFRILDVHARQMDTTDYHKHEKNLCYFVIEGGMIYLQETDGSHRVIEMTRGDIGSRDDHVDSPYVHRFAQLSQKEFKLIAVESLRDPELVENYVERDPNPAYPVHLENKSFFVHKFRLYSNQIKEYNFGATGVLINAGKKTFSAKQANLDHHLYKFGDFVPVTRTDALTISSVEGTNFVFIGIR